jgi:hypothetical protein
MRELLLELCFACCNCCDQTCATVHCSGNGMKNWPRAHAAAHIRCPHCGTANTIIFSIGSGHVAEVLPCDEPFLAPVPSHN